jgi:xanthine dehydrogenase molybdenum-binding subunit
MKAVHDASYAASLRNEEWQALVLSPEFDELVGEYPELAQRFIAANRSKLAAYGVGVARHAAPNRSLQQAEEEFSVVGKRIQRIQGLGVVTDLGNYVSNMSMPRMVFQRTLRSPHPHARVLSIDDSQARALPGVVDIIHRFNLSEDENVRITAGPPAHYLFDEEIFTVGDAVAALVAEDMHTADEAIRLIEVEYEILPAVIDWRDGINPSTPKQWDSDFPGTISSVSEELMGDPDAALSEADLVVEVASSRSTEQHMALELTSNLTWWDQGRVHMYYTNQHAHGSRSGLAQRLGLPQSAVHVVQTGYMGSGYGYRSGIDVDEVHSAILSARTGRPVKRMATRSEDFVTRTRRPQFFNTVKVGFTQDGTITAIVADVVSNVGAGGSGASGSLYQYENLYTTPNLGLKATDVRTNTGRAGPYRCVSHPAGTLGLEVAMDEAAYRLGIDPVELRLKNFNLIGSPGGNPYSNPGIADTLTAAAERIGWTEKWHAPRAMEVRPGVFHGIGVACHTCSHGAGSGGGSGVVIIHSDGSMNVLSGSTDIGPGQRTLMAMIAAEAAGVPWERTFITPHVDTDMTSDTGATNGSRQTNTAGWGIYQAGMDARRQLLEHGAALFIENAAEEEPPRTITVTPDQLDVKDGQVFFRDDPTMALPINQVVASSSGPIIGRGVHIQAPGFSRAAFATGIAEVEVDTVTGSVMVTRYVSAHDVGKVLNPFALEQQVEGGAIMGLGAALTEEILVDQATGLPYTDNMLEYKALSILDVPPTIDTVFVERPKEYGVYGAHGVGEPIMGPPGPAVSNAVYNAIGVRIADLPITREKVLAALKGA